MNALIAYRPRDLLTVGTPIIELPNDVSIDFESDRLTYATGLGGHSLEVVVSILKTRRQWSLAAFTSALADNLPSGSFTLVLVTQNSWRETAWAIWRNSAGLILGEEVTKPGDPLLGKYYQSHGPGHALQLHSGYAVDDKPAPLSLIYVLQAFGLENPLKAPAIHNARWKQGVVTLDSAQLLKEFHLLVELVGLPAKR